MALSTGIVSYPQVRWLFVHKIRDLRNSMHGKAEKLASSKTVDRESDHMSAEKPISLAPLDFEEAIETLLRVKPDRENENKHGSESTGDD